MMTVENHGQELQIIPAFPALMVQHHAGVTEFVVRVAFQVGGEAA
jgi:hypothetical protein